MENRTTLTIKLLINILIFISLFSATKIFLPTIDKIQWHCYFIYSLILILIYINNIIGILKKLPIKKLKLFNVYYINYTKVFEICMLIDNKRMQSQESIYKDEFTNTYSLTNNNIVPILNKENSNTKTYEHRAIESIINTNSTYLNEIIDVCKNLNDNELHNGDLVKINNVELEIINKKEIAQINSMISGIFNGNKISTNSDGQSFNLDVNALSNILLKDYKYTLKGKIDDNKEFYINIPIKAENEFENNYSIYDLEIGKVNIIGIYKTDNYNYDKRSTFEYLQKLGGNNNDNYELSSADKLIKSNFEQKKESTKEKNSTNVNYYIDLIAIVQDLKIKKDESNE